jgi:small GTP-binding protein
MPQTYKIILAVPAASGKTAIRDFLQEKVPPHTYAQSVGIDLTTYKLTNSDKQLQIWELPGQEQFAVNNSIYYRGAEAILITCDLTDKELKVNIQRFLEVNKKHFPKDAPVFLVGTKLDASYQNQQESMAQLKSIAKNNSLDIPDEHIVLCSNQTGVGILNLFNELIPSALFKKSELEQKRQDSKQKKSFDFQQPIKLILQRIKVSRLPHHVEHNPWRYGLGLLLMLTATALFAIPGFATAIGFGAAISSATFATATSLGISLIGAKALLGVAAGIMAFLTVQLVGYLSSRAIQTAKNKYWRKSVEVPFMHQKSQSFYYTPPANNNTYTATGEGNSMLARMNDKSGSKSFCFSFG